MSTLVYMLMLLMSFVAMYMMLLQVYYEALVVDSDVVHGNANHGTFVVYTRMGP